MNTTQTDLPFSKKNVMGMVLVILGAVIAIIIVAIVVMSLFFKSQATGSGLESLASGLFALYGIVAIVVITLVMLLILPFYLTARRKNTVQVDKKKGPLRQVIGIILLVWLSIILIYIISQLFS